MFEVIGYEGRCNDNRPLKWGAAAVRSGARIWNAVTGFEDRDWQKYVDLGIVTSLETPVPLLDNTFGKYCVMDLRIDLLDRAPYKVDIDFLFMDSIVAVGRGRTRGYYVFKEHDNIWKWLYKMNAQNFELVECAK